MMTFHRTNNDLLMSIDSFAEIPVVPVWPTLSEPAKSTNWSFDTITSSMLAGSIVSSVIVKIAWDLEDA